MDGVDGSSVGKVNSNAAALVENLTGKKLATTDKKPPTTKDAAPAVKGVTDKKPPTTKDAPPVRTINPDTNKFRFNNSNKFIPRHSALNQDMTKLATLTEATFPRQVRKDFTEGAKETQAQARQVQKYLSQFDTPADALMNAVSESGDPKSKKYRTYDESTEAQPSGTLPIGKDPLAENLQGTGGANAKAVLSWAKDNLSAETNAQLNIKLEAAKERAATAEAKVTELSSKAAETKKVEDRKKEADAKRE